MATTYERGKIYTFAFSRIAIWNDGRYIVLKEKDTGSEKPDGYAASPWVLRVKALPFQEKWEDGDEWPEFDCLVTGFMQDYGVATTFPQLVQDRRFVNERLYGNADPDVAIPFRAADPPGSIGSNGSVSKRWRLLDPKTGYFHGFYGADGESEMFSIGQIVEVHPDKDNAKGELRFVSGEKYGRKQAIRNRLRDMPKAFPEGTEEICEVVSADDPKFVKLRHPTIATELQIPRPASGKAPAVGDLVTVKCIGFSPTGWPLLEWTGDWAQSTISVDNLPVLNLPAGGESKTVEYKSSLVYPAGGTAPDVDKQLGLVIIRTVASMANAEGGSIFVGVRNDGTVCGVEKEGPFLMTDSEDETHYPADSDGMQLKITNTVKRKLGDSAGSLVEVLPRQNPESTHLVLEIKVRPSETDLPVFVNGTDLYARYPGESQKLVGEEAARFVVDRLRRLDEKRHGGKPADGGAVEDLIKRISDILPVQDPAPAPAPAPAAPKKKPATIHGLPIVAASNTTVPFERHHVDALDGFEGLAFDGKFVGAARNWSDMLLEVLKQLALVDPAKFEALPDELSFRGRGGRPVFARRGSRTHLRDASGYLGPKNDIRADRRDGYKENFLKDDGLFVRLVRHFGLKPEQFRIWTGKQ